MHLFFPSLPQFSFWALRLSVELLPFIPDYLLSRRGGNASPGHSGNGCANTLHFFTSNILCKCPSITYKAHSYPAKVYFLRLIEPHNSHRKLASSRSFFPGFMCLNHFRGEWIRQRESWTDDTVGCTFWHEIWCEFLPPMLVIRSIIK